MRPARTKVWAEIPRRRKPVVQRRRWPHLRFTAGKAIVTVWFTCRLLPDQQSAMYTLTAVKEEAGSGVKIVARAWREGADQKWELIEIDSKQLTM